MILVTSRAKYMYMLQKSSVGFLESSGCTQRTSFDLFNTDIEYLSFSFCTHLGGLLLIDMDSSTFTPKYLVRAYLYKSFISKRSEHNFSNLSIPKCPEIEAPPST